MSSYFTCARCGLVTALNELQTHCPRCGSMSGEYSSELPQEPSGREESAADGDAAGAR